MIRRFPVLFFFLVSIVLCTATLLLMRPGRPLQRLNRGLPVVIFSVLGCGGVLLAFLRRQGKIARGVVQRLHDGDLSARLPVGKLAGFDGLVVQFNKMADDIEKLVVKLRESEKLRAETVREIAHDVRTPLTSLRLAVESGKLGAAGVEITYLQDLIDGLLLLAQIQDGDFRSAPESFDLSQLAREEVDRFQDLPDRLHLTFELKDETGGRAFVEGSRVLMTRALRNTLENAARFARTKVTLTLRSCDLRWEVVIRDDGPGFTEQAMGFFGVRRPTRYVDAGSSSRLSVGLGTVIVKRVIESGGGLVVPSNWGGGAEVRLFIPRRRDSYSDRESINSAA